MTLYLELTEASAADSRPLTPAQVATLATVPKLVTLTPTSSGLWRIAGRQRVGTVRLGVGDGAVELRINPKLTVRHLMYLLGYDKDPTIWKDQQVNAAKADVLVAVIADIFARILDRVLRGGVLHGYVHREDALTVVRGRIRAGAQLSRRLGVPTAIEVAYDDYIADIPENQILLGAIELVQSLRGVSKNTALLLRHLSARLVDITSVRPGAPLPAWRSTRLNERYIPALHLAELILTGASLQQNGPVSMQIDGFVINMAQIFERFLTAQLTDVLRPHGLRCAAQQGHRLDQAGQVLFQPDILAYRNGRPAVVIDAKYRTLESAPPTSHLFQLISYCTALGIREGHLVYAAGTALPMPYRVTYSDILIWAHVLDLNQTPTALRQTTARIAGKILD
ncbi:McrC family protein [Planotetraspora kaengkrachanensis]|uniref:McrBC 5-methylcytosine restriction system component n=1 Tax=Planotetraspora kaengkrachanensis TaxID=575193 RepID=A0A8J3LY72_9ACTN|nr:hypothetical protein [Planotetraspora kaengkrachanensis]GIG80039.1 McrBC 5-methylcytosine restriction system component [Planotetraspora kaengkrachanensis]